jgi:pimeloyl-ACP methyl ester carboxylesterase
MHIFRSVNQALAAGFVALLATGCAIPGPVTSEQAMESAIPRHELKRAGNCTLSYLEAGDPKGKTVIFIHGTPGEAGGWADYLMHVPEGFHYVALDRPGFGSSGPDDAVTSLGEQASAVAQLISHVSKSPVALVGHSLGGPIAAQTAVDFPAQVEGLVILAGSLDPAQESVPLIQFIGDTWPISALLPRTIRNANREIIALKPQLEALAPRLAGITVPVTIVHGTADDLVPFANVSFMKLHMVGTRDMDVTEIKGQNHFLPWNAKPKVDAAITKVFSMMKPARAATGQ